MPDLRTRLQRLRPASRKPKAAAPPPRPAEASATGLPGREVTTPVGSFQLIEERYPLDLAHGPRALGDVLTRDAATAARLTRVTAHAGIDLNGLAFVDTETTGLAGGAGTLAFLIGVGVFEAGQFVLRQYFMRDPDEEMALLALLVEDLRPRSAWVTFNGRSFDFPILETRLTLNRQRRDVEMLRARPHLDLLFPARWLYRGRLESCSLGSLEQNILQVVRDQADVPGELIPGMYLDYLRTGDAGDMRRVLYHNAVDILSMVTLAAHLFEVYAADAHDQRWSEARQPPGDLLRLARWHADHDRAAEAEAAYRRALARRLPSEDRQEGLRHFAALLKRQGRRAEAVPLWEQWAAFSTDDPLPFVELAKYFEWEAADVDQALAWAERALRVCAAWPRGWRRDAAVAQTEHRLSRLKAKRASRTAS